MVARTKKGRTEEEKKFGIQIDSLVDMFSFGIFPAIIGYTMGLNGWLWSVSYTHLAYLISVDIWLFLHPELNVIYSEDEIAYFTIHIQYSLMRNHLKNKKRVLLINNLNSSSTELLSYELLQEFDEFMEIVDSIHIRQLEDIHMEKYDLVISTSARCV